MAGIVYGKKFLEGKEEVATAKIVQRMKQMYVWQTALFLAVALCLLFSEKYLGNWKTLHGLVAAWSGNEGIHFFLDHPLQAFGLGCFFLYLPPFFDILPMYIFFLSATPLILRKLQQGRLYLVAGTSLIIWLAAKCIPSRLLETTLKIYLPSVKLGWVDLLSWQLLFVGGLIFGYLKIGGRLPKPSRPLIALSSLFALFFFYLKNWGASYPPGASLYELGPLRLISFGAMACTVWGLERWLAFRPLAFLGKNSLQVFLYHAALLYFLIFFQNEITALRFSSKMILMACCVLSLWIPAYASDRRKLTGNLKEKVADA